MKKAYTVSEMPNAFRAEPLEAADMARFYEDTMLVRTGQEGESPIEDIYERCCEPQRRNASLLMGHMGCGKSTELNRLAERLIDEGRPAHIVYCNQEVDGGDKTFPDVMILMADALLRLAEENDCELNEEDLETLRTFWTSSLEKEDIVFDGTELAVNAGGALKAPLLPGLLKLFANLKAGLKYNVESREIYREQVLRRNSQWLGAVNRVADQITEKTGSQPIIIFEDLDKGETWDVFSGHGSQLTGVTFPVVYTFPIGYYYSPDFAEIDSFFHVNRLPMIKTANIDGSPNPKGHAIIRAIVERRADPTLFADGVLDSMIDRTGGCLRHLFRAISKAAILARRLNKTQVTAELADRALTEIKSDLSARVEGKEHDFLKEVAGGRHREIDDKPTLLRMMQALTVLEYNGERWYDVHPLMKEYLREIKKLPKESHEG